MRMWRNWYTRTLEVRVGFPLRVRVSLSAFLSAELKILRSQCFITGFPLAQKELLALKPLSALAK
jgi:hypothetical protein